MPNDDLLLAIAREALPSYIEPEDARRDLQRALDKVGARIVDKGDEHGQG